jgi:phenylacetate-CoA ligase
MILEEWIHDRIRQQVQEAPEFQKHLSGRDLTDITSDVIRDFQFFKLKRTLDLVYENSSFYRELYQASGVNPDDIQSMEDMPKMPFVTPRNLWEEPNRLLCVSLTEIDRMFTRVTSGTTGNPKRISFSRDDLETMTDSMAPVMETPLSLCAIDPKGCRVQIFLANGSALSQVHLVAKGVEKMGGIPASGDIFASTEDQIGSILEAKPTMLMGSATRIYRITQEARQFLDLPSLGVKVLFITSEYLSPAMRRHLADFWQAEAFHHYGMTETGLVGAIECSAHDGYHINEADFLFEVVNPESGDLLADGEEGELIFTSLSRRAMPLIRYRTGDIAKLISTPCECGASTVRRIGTIAKRVGSVETIAGGKVIHPSLFDNVVYSFPDVVDYRILLTKEADKEALTCKVELVGNERSIEDELADALCNIEPVKEGVESGLLSEPRIEFAEPGEITRTGRMKQRIMDERESS